MPQLRVEAYDLGIPTPLSSELDLTVYVKNVDDFKPIFTVKSFQAEFTGTNIKTWPLYNEIIASFTEKNYIYSENQRIGKEKIQLPSTIDGDDDDDEDESERKEVCYFLLSNETSKEEELFFVHPTDHTLYTRKELDREQQENYQVYIFATDNCFFQEQESHKRTLAWAMKESEKSILKVDLKIADVNDNR